MKKIIRTSSGKWRKKINMKYSSSAQYTLQLLHLLSDNSDDIVFQKKLTSEGIVTIIYSKTLIDIMTLQAIVLVPLAHSIHQIQQTAVQIEYNQITELENKINAGYTILYFHETGQYLALDTYSAPDRAVSETEIESTVIGPQDSFTESLKTNISLIRRRIQEHSLKNENICIGTENQYEISIMYMDNIVNRRLLKKLKKRLQHIESPQLLDIAMLKQFIEDNPLSPFPQYYMTARPDTITHYLLDGRIALLMDNSQTAIICPTSFFEMFTTIEDYYNRWTTATLLRSLRFFGFFLTIMITPMYISTLTFHPELLPYELLLNLQESRSRVPFPPLFEVLFIELIIEILREAGSRMPAKVGQTIGIVGGIVIGTAAVEAGLISNILIVLVATSALLSFLPPFFLMSNTSRLIRYFFIIAAGTFGLFGQMLAFAWLIIHLLSLRSLGEPYMAPILPRKWTDLFNSVIRFPLAFLKERMGISKSPKG
ncbi:spore germination protein [Metasolibacillus meyeri]|uniref:Spore germination protein n=1 Tax=Metasolibacillus meyeri TaxID=1071052 RepID=A0AAW9NVM1_9BACL|nr:spore germination protein [Metasolibacillus meyeri]MEC1178968.1 spore germination protein [Metasolibacillus meyeri]